MLKTNQRSIVFLELVQCIVEQRIWQTRQDNTLIEQKQQCKVSSQKTKWINIDIEHILTTTIKLVSNIQFQIYEYGFVYYWLQSSRTNLETLNHYNLTTPVWMLQCPLSGKAVYWLALSGMYSSLVACARENPNASHAY